MRERIQRARRGERPLRAGGGCAAALRSAAPGTGPGEPGKRGGGGVCCTGGVFGRADPAVLGAKFGAVFVGRRSGPGPGEPNGAGAAPGPAAPGPAALPFVPPAALSFPRFLFSPLPPSLSPH